MAPVKKKKQCPKCGKLVVRVDVHMATHMTVEERRAAGCECAKCGKVFNRRRYAMKHEKGCGNLTTCDICAAKVMDLKQHKKNYHGAVGRRYFCDACPYESSSKKAIRSHVQAHTREKRFESQSVRRHLPVCLLCGRQFINTANRAIHGKLAHGSSTPAEIQELLDIVAPHVGIGIDIVAVADGEEPVVTAPADTGETSTPSAPPTEERKQPTCERCGVSFISNRILKMHVKFDPDCGKEGDD